MRKILASLLVAAMVLGLVGTAFAGFSDTAKHVDEKFIDKATAFSWLKGYPDGSFKPAGNITRAEFAAVVVRALGLEAAASSTAGLATKFKDVPSTHWGAGYINVATNKGVIKGYPDGTFKPEANVTNAEAITMVVRALNRESDAIGEWPVGHITVAASVNVIGTGFASNALATRADVARYVAKAADVKHKELTTNGWIESTDKTFLKYNNLDKLTGSVTNTDTVNKTVSIDVTTPALGPNTYTMDSKGLVANNMSLVDIKGYSVDAFKDKDTNKLVFIEPSTTATVKKGDVRSVGTNFFYLYDDTTKYEVTLPATGVTGTSVIRNNATVSYDKLLVDDAITFFIGADGKVNYINARGYTYSRAVVTDMYTAGSPMSLTIKRIQGGMTAYPNNTFNSNTFTLATDCKVELNGADAKFTDLKKGDIVSVAADPNNSTVATIINAGNKSVSGKVTAKRVTYGDDGLTRHFISIDGVEYRLEMYSEIKDSNNSTTSDALIYSQIKVGASVTIFLSQRGRVRVVDLVSGVADAGRIKRFVTAAGSGYDTWVMDVRGTETTYEVAKDSISGNSKHNNLIAVTGLGRALRPGDYVSLTLDSDNRVKAVEILVNPMAYGDANNPSVLTLGDVYGGDRIITLAGKAYLVTNDTVMYVNDAVGTLASVAKDQKAAIAFTTGDIKLKALIVDTFARMDAAAITGAITSNGTKFKVNGFDKAAEPWALVQIMRGTTVLASDYADDAGGWKAPHNSYRPGNTGYNGGFSTTEVDYITTGTPTATQAVKGETLTVRVTDRFGNVTSAQIVVP